MKILYIEDNVNNLVLVKKILEPFFSEFLIAENGEEGLNILLNENPDVALIDLNLPDLSGFEILKRYKSSNLESTTVFIAISGYTDKHTIKDVFKAGFDGFVEKPVDVEKLYEYLINIHKTKNSEKKEISSTQKISQKINTVELWDEIIETISHELKTPITSLMIDISNNKIDKNKIMSFLNNYIKEIEELTSFLKNQYQIINGKRNFFFIDELISYLEQKYNINITHINSKKKIFHNYELIKYLFDIIVKNILSLTNKKYSITISTDEKNVNIIFEDCLDNKKLAMIDKNNYLMKIIEKLNAKIFTDQNNLFLILPIWG
ncbi:hypothetical protein DEFDS_0954 [Deferribacter desulfuricans SSM1]|uniref:Response regulatory domain-containing protein n=1 Tax=Deferribacter desulfuricans (strain DSM 14783 / JCM 11476 / NBRC 101012 / SSM1) TaxID=639282 RepID=D3PCV3_DEFDS|nr:response regulator [Deferribacter desulfuricans]BAI80426.1 hypothetical protein DEFDS_0954 [Deferribacter desulfuricans SSM1]